MINKITKNILCDILFLMKISKELSDLQILVELGKRIKACRIRKSYTQKSFSAVKNQVQILLPASETSPMELIYSKSEKQRQRVRKNSGSQEKNSSGWKWGEDE